MTRITEIFDTCSLPFSIEVFPPKGELAIEDARSILEGMALANPSFISVTCSAGGSGNGTGTIPMAALVQNEVGVASVAHLTCVNSSKESIAESMTAMKDASIENVLALRGDKVGDVREGASDFRHAKDLIPVLKEEGFCVGAAAYPEGHISCLDPDADMRHLKEKQSAGADFFVTQLCFDNEVLYRFKDKAEHTGIDKPIIFGIMPFLGKSQIERMVFMCGSSLPSRIIKLLAKYEDDAVSLRQAGVEYACEQLVDLGKNNVDGLHIYSMDHPDIAQAANDALVAAGLRG